MSVSNQLTIKIFLSIFAGVILYYLIFNIYPLRHTKVGVCENDIQGTTMPPLNHFRNNDVLLIGTSETTQGLTSRFDTKVETFTTILNQDAGFPYTINTISTRAFMVDIYYFLKAYRTKLQNKTVIVSLNSFYLNKEYTQDETIMTKNIGGQYGTRIFGRNFEFYKAQVFDTPTVTSGEAKMKNKLKSDNFIFDHETTPYIPHDSLPINKFNDYIQCQILTTFDPKYLFIKRPINYDREIPRAQEAVRLDPDYRVNSDFNVRFKMDTSPSLLKDYQKNNFFASPLILDAIESMAQLVNQENINLIFILHPSNKIFEEKIGFNRTERDKYYQKITKILDDNHIKYINLNDDFVWEGTFADTVHLNSYGAYILAQKIKPQLSEYLKN